MRQSAKRGNRWEIEFEELEVDKRIGQGAYGSVFKGTHDTTQTAHTQHNTHDTHSTRAGERPQANDMCGIVDYVGKWRNTVVAIKTIRENMASFHEAKFKEFRGEAEMMMYPLSPSLALATAIIFSSRTGVRARCTPQQGHAAAHQRCTVVWGVHASVHGTTMPLPPPI
jgi:hypothetical protein